MAGSDKPADISEKSTGQPPAKRRCRREGGKWTRSGCLTCKRRRKRCDEAKPSCQSCMRLGLACEGYGSMWATPLGPGAHAFQQIEPSKQREPSPSPTPSVSSTLSPGQTSPACFSVGSPVAESTHITPASSLSGQDDSEELVDRGQTLGQRDQLVIATPSPSRLISHLSTSDTQYLQYHLEYGSRLLANLETDENPLRSLLIPRALSSPLLMNALCALSATHFSNRAHGSWSAEHEGAKYYIDTMRGLQTALSKSHSRPIQDDAILAVALLCKYEITRGSVKQWAVHLEALDSLVLSRGGLSHLDDDTAEFVRGLLIYANNVAKITNQRTIKTPTSVLEHPCSRKLDIYIGYTEELLKICARIADLPLLSADLLALGSEINTIDTLLRTWTSSKTTYIVPKGITESAVSRLRMVADSFRNAAYIYLHSTLEQMAPSQSDMSLNISRSKPAAIQHLLQGIKDNPIDSNCEYSALTFPLFIAGCEAISGTDRDLLLRSLTTLEANFGIGNVKRAKELLVVLWRSNGDMHWMDVLEGLGWDLILA
ncbi:fungal-specific transcription factor domain-containing protein [Aspergillus pseudoustus]|uniref:Fungal-specific transcription factor domain-containing protein n=1 Tax=Aspergillus pseudoustus TaxID=1810923 RepID=A0ABR4KZV8_9EURO